MSWSVRGQATSFKTVGARLDRGDPVNTDDYWITPLEPIIGGAPPDPLAGDDDFDLIAPLSRDG